MKKVFNLLVFIVFATTICCGQEYTYQPWQPSMGPLDFMTLGNAQHPYVQCKYGSSYNNPTTIGINGSGAASSHALITSNSPDPCRCYPVASQYVHEMLLPPSWDGTPNEFQSSAIRIGCGISNSICYKAAQIEYWFYPEDAMSTLLVMSSLAIQNVTTTHGTESGCGSLRNPQFYIEVRDGETDQLLDIGYYPTQASQGTFNPVPNTNWPYSQFLAWPSGCGADNDTYTDPDDYGISTFYWVGQNSYGYATPTTFGYRECPASQTSGASNTYPVAWFEYKPLAFNLKNLAAQNVNAQGQFEPHKSVKLRIFTYGCNATAHWGYGLFSAKIVPGDIQVTCYDHSLHMSVPYGFIPQTYEWHYGYDSADASNHLLDLYNPAPGITPDGINGFWIDYDQANLYPYYRCEMKSYTGVPFVFEANIGTEYILEPDFSYEQSFSGDEVMVQFHDESLIYSVTPGYCPGADTISLDIDLDQIQWYVKNGDNYQLFAENDANPVHSFDADMIDEDGTITVKIVVGAVVDGVSCADSIEKVIPISSVGVPEHQLPIRLVYPNPTSTMAYVQCSVQDVQLMGGKMQLIDVHGNVLHESPVVSEITEIDMSQYAAGAYFVKWVSEGKTLAVQKVVKK